MTFEAPHMRLRRMLLPSVARSDVPQPLIRWPGPPAGAPVFFDPKIRTNLFLKSFGWPSDCFAPWFPRADARELLTLRQRAAVTSSGFNGGSDTRAIPAVFVPTSIANSYQGMSTL
jgi:hypothetical protein